MGGLASALPLAAIPFVPVAGDAVAVVLAVAGASITGWLFRERRKLDALPLELAPVAARGRVDGVDVVRIRARLGLGRALRDPRVRVRVVPEDGPAVSLAAPAVTDHLCGPFTIVASVPAGVLAQGGTIEARVAVRSAGREWSAEARYPVSELVVGRFDRGLERGRRGLAFADGWDAPSPSEP